MNEGCDLEYIAPSKSNDGSDVAIISNSEIQENVLKWSNTLVGYIIGNNHFILT